MKKQDNNRHPGRAALQRELASLEKAALGGRPGRSRAQACREAGQTTSTASDWFKGNSVPGEFDALWSLVAVLERWWMEANPRPSQNVETTLAARRKKWRALWDQARETPPAGTAPQGASHSQPAAAAPSSSTEAVPRRTEADPEAVHDGPGSEPTLSLAGCVLLPVGLDALFFPITSISDDSRHLEFAFKAEGALTFLVSELVSQGATGVGTDPGSSLAAARAGLSPPVRGLTRVLDATNETREMINLAFRPIAAELGLDPQRVDVVGHPITGPQGYVTELAPEKQKSWSDLLLVHSTTYHLLLGIDSRVQIDVPLREFSAAVHRLRRSAQSSVSATTLGFLNTVAHSYHPHLVGAVSPLVSSLDSPWIDAFETYIKEVAYQEYTAIRSELGYLAGAEAMLERTWSVSRRLLNLASAKNLLKQTVRTVKISSGTSSRPPAALADYFARTRYLPPVIKTTAPLTRALNAWNARHQYGMLHFKFNHFEWLSGSRIPRLQTGAAKVSLDWMQKEYKSDPPGDIREEAMQLAFEKFFARNLIAPCECPVHGYVVCYDDLDVRWGDEDLEVSFAVCCEEAGRMTLVNMMAYRSLRT
ncbi:hypothetical protein ACGFS9_31810 [Streptomyces sp. NPDC048566]|uniref:hypothetical protein n=1 Tax=Streptomyces sp. NPDC048566 TaxID=3365569 RepID=UPI003716ACB3